MTTKCPTWLRQHFSALLDLHNKYKIKQPPKPHRHITGVTAGCYAFRAVWPAAPSRGQHVGRRRRPGAAAAWMRALEQTAKLGLAISGMYSNRQGILFRMASGFICTCCKSDRKGLVFFVVWFFCVWVVFFFLINIPISSLSLEKATPVVSGMSDDTAVFLIHYIGKFRALSHRHFCICTA